jgi:hypothetical protein
MLSENVNLPFSLFNLDNLCELLNPHGYDLDNSYVVEF